MHAKRLTLIAIAAIAAGYTLLSSAGSAIDVPRRQAPATVARDELARFDIASRLKPLPLALAGLDFEPVDLAGTPLAALTSLGGMAEDVQGEHARLYRSFRLPDGRTVTLVEHDMAADGTRDPHDSTASRERSAMDAPERVNDRPARLDVLHGSAGRAVSILSWQEGQRDYQLWIDAAAQGEARQQLFALAAALPTSVAAKPDAPAVPATPAT
ncbi:hypothetical protein QPK32_06545 [Massilia sp. YIM B02763]|uniref:hypothetical protein n=1 Tax=Massilia sp. YIM B02763 TaxID=3050130 RepID=UPI0025B6DDA1|nr:hypothetical protein [Massilia sp. YIM B02763]MDN4052728.1 hypothetical protein [Massilia sp. YIM B02763]